MRITETPIAGAFLIEIDPIADERGFFARTWCVNELRRHGLQAGLVQCSLSHNRKRGTLRGLHRQVAPHEETKIVRCPRGGIYDVILDLRPDSPTYRRWHGAELSETNHRALYIPGGVAHGFQTLVDDSDVHYQMSEFFHPESARGVRWDDPAFGIAWPIADPIMSQRDRSYPAFEERPT